METALVASSKLEILLATVFRLLTTSNSKPETGNSNLSIHFPLKTIIVRNSTDNLRLEPVSEKHAAAIQQLASDPLVIETTALPSPYPENGAVTWIEFLEPRTQAGKDYAFAIIRNDETLVGVCGFNNVPRDKQRVEFGYWIGTPYWNRGYATAAGRLAMEIGFNQFVFQCMYAPVLERNKASQRVLEKLGFRRTRSYPNTIYPKWAPTEILVEFELTSNEWNNRHQ